jgi:two-component system copper resistance phosphate regulon response regulator CusR
MKVLVVEDEPKTATYLRTGLVENGFVVDVVHRGDNALDAATTGAYDLILLDVMLPHQDGWSVLAGFAPLETSRPCSCSQRAKACRTA